MNEQYSLYSRFDIEKHKATYVNYLEIIIGADGTTAYAVPSHQEFLIKVACAKNGWTRDQLKAACPREYWWDFMEWLSIITGAMAVWNEHFVCHKPTVKQIGMLRKLKMAGIYKGAIPNISEMDGEK